ncbi:MAG: hypothetical protein PVTTEEND_001566, partial [Candidatus Fervidibacter sp.]
MPTADLPAVSVVADSHSNNLPVAICQSLPSSALAHSLMGNTKVCPHL